MAGMTWEDQNSPVDTGAPAGPPPSGAFAPLPVDEPVSPETPTFDQPPALNEAPAGPAAAPTRPAISPLMRETRKIIDDLMEKGPGYSKTLPPMRDGLGDSILTPP